MRHLVRFGTPEYRTGKDLRYTAVPPRPRGRCWEHALSELVTAPPVSQAVRLPPAAPIPKPLCGLFFATSRRGMIKLLARRYGNVFAINLPMFGRVVVVGEP